jgi:cytoskeletal protein CcmA (bactofilin family)
MTARDDADWSLGLNDPTTMHRSLCGSPSTATAAAISPATLASRTCGHFGAPASIDRQRALGDDPKSKRSLRLREEASMNNPKNPPPVPEKRTIVEEGTELKGSITSTCPIVVQGSIDGEVAGPSVEVSATGTIAGKITTGTLNSKGRIAGELDVDVAQLSGTVANKTVVRAATLDLKISNPNGKVELKFTTGRGGGLSS